MRRAGGVLARAVVDRALGRAVHRRRVDDLRAGDRPSGATATAAAAAVTAARGDYHREADASNAATATRTFARPSCAEANLLRPDICVPPRSPTTRTVPPSTGARCEWKQIRLPSAPRCPISRRTLHPDGQCRKIYLARMNKLLHPGCGTGTGSAPRLRPHETAAGRGYAHPHVRVAGARRRRRAGRRRRAQAVSRVRRVGQPDGDPRGRLRREQHRLAGRPAAARAHHAHLRLRPRRARLERRDARRARRRRRGARPPAAAVLGAHRTAVRAGGSLLRRAAYPAVRVRASARRRGHGAGRRGGQKHDGAPARDLAAIGEPGHPAGGGAAGHRRRRRALGRSSSTTGCARSAACRWW